MGRSTGALVTSPFDGTWRPRYDPPGLDAPPDVVSLMHGLFECRSCRPPYGVPADGREHEGDGNPRFATLQIIVVDDRTVRLVGRREGLITYESTLVAGADGNTMVETRTAAAQAGDVLVPMLSGRHDGSDDEPRHVMFRISLERVGAPISGAHLVSGSWRVVELDLLDHDEDTTYHLSGDQLVMSDRMGRSYAAILDGSIAPYLGDPRFTGVSMRRIDGRTIEETNLAGDAVVQVTTWRVDVDGRTMHVRFDDGAGHVMEQTGFKVR
jgi:hypothetical protein